MISFGNIWPLWLILWFLFFFCIHVALYSIILFCVFLWIPFVYFYYEERDDDSGNKCSVRMHLPNTAARSAEEFRFHSNDSNETDQCISTNLRLHEHIYLHSFGMTNNESKCVIFNIYVPKLLSISMSFFQCYINL